MSSERAMNVWAIISSSIDASNSGRARWPRIRRAAAHGHRRGRSDLLGDLTGLLIEAFGRNQARDDAVPECLPGVEDPARQDHVGRQPVTAHLEQPTDAPRVGDHPVADLGEHEPCPLGRHPDVAEQGALERCTDGPALERHDDGNVQLEDGPDALMAAPHELVVGHPAVGPAQGTDVSP